MENDLISRSALKDALLKLAEEAEGNIALPADVNDLLLDAPAIDPESLRPVAYWQYDPNGIDWGLGAWVCSRCGEKNDNVRCQKDVSPHRFVGARYCPNCGAKMGGTSAVSRTVKNDESPLHELTSEELPRYKIPPLEPPKECDKNAY